VQLQLQLSWVLYFYDAAAAARGRCSTWLLWNDYQDYWNHPLALDIQDLLFWTFGSFGGSLIKLYRLKSTQYLSVLIKTF
jgi:hypothetical protein